MTSTHAQLIILFIGFLQLFSSSQLLASDPLCINGYNVITRVPCENSYTVSTPFLIQIPDARSLGMGGTGIATSNNSNAIHFNNSRSVFSQTPVINAAGSFAFNEEFPGNTEHFFLAGHFSLNENSALNGSVKYNVPAKFLFFNHLEGIRLPENRKNEIEIAIGFAQKLGEKFALGITPKFIYSDLYGENQDHLTAGVSAAFDFSSTFQSSLNLGNQKVIFTSGISIKNLGTGITYTKSINKFHLPASLGLGAGILINPGESHQFQFAVDLIKILAPYEMYECGGFGDCRPNSSPEVTYRALVDNTFLEGQLKLGAEYILKEIFSFRLGLNSPARRQVLKFNCGLGMKIKKWELNIGFEQHLQKDELTPLQILATGLTYRLQE